MPTDARAFLPLTNLAFQVLLSLGRSARHGYAIIKDIERRTSGTMLLRSGTLYTAIQRLVAAGLVEPAAAPDDDDGDERRRFYRVSGLGLEVAALETERLEGLLRTARERDLARASNAMAR